MSRLKRWLNHPAALILLAIALTLGGALATGAVLAQDPAPVSGERDGEGAAGSAGAIRDLGAEDLPALQPEDMNVVYHFAGALNNTGATVPKATVVQCSNVDDSETTQIEVQLFEYNATSVYTGTISIDPMKTATFESSQVDFYTADVFMNAGFVEQGYGRILAEHDNLVCTVQTVDPDNSPPTWSFDLPLYHPSANGVLLPMVLKNTAP